MSFKFKGEDVTVISIDEREKYSILRIKDRREYKGNVTNPEFDIFCNNKNMIAGLNIGDTLTIEGTIGSKMNDRGFLNYSFSLVTLKKTKESEGQGVASNEYSDDDLPF